MIGQSAFRSINALVIATCFAFASASSLAVEIPTTTLLPVEPGTPEERSTPFIAWFGDLSEVGYEEEEYLISGGANVYEYVDNDAQSTDVWIRDVEVPYTSRILVRKPTNPKKFNGTVYVEILNPTAGWDGDAVWGMNHEYLQREGAVYVGLTSKPVALNFLRDSWGQDPFPPRNNSRYATLEMPFFGQVWDMLSELGALLKTKNDPNNPLTGMRVKRLIMGGYSQSAAYQVTYANSFHDNATMPNGSPIYDGYYVAAGGDQAKNVQRPTPEEENLPEGDARNLINVDVPVVRFQTETEVIGFGSYAVRQTEPDYPLVRYYEMAGGSHADKATNEVGGVALARDLGLPDFAAFCELDLNPIRIGFVQSALLEVTDQWVRKHQARRYPRRYHKWNRFSRHVRGRNPPRSRLVELTTDETGNTVIAVDDDGHALGGIRPPTLEVPLGNYLAFNTGGGFCFLFGGFTAFDDEELASRYPSHRKYVKRVARKTIRSVRKRFLLPRDGVTLIKEAVRSDVGK